MVRLEVVVLDDCGGVLVLVLEDVEGESVERLRLICIVYGGVSMIWSRGKKTSKKL